MFYRFYTDVGVTAIVPFVRAFALVPGWVPLSVFGMGLMMYGTMEFVDLEATLVDAVWSVFYYGITGASIGWAYNLADSKKKAA